MQDPEVSHYSACNAAMPTSSNMETSYSNVETSYSDISTLGRISSSVHTGWLGTSRGGGGLCTENSMRHFAVGSANEQQMLRGGRILSLTDHLIIILSSCCHHHEKWQSWELWGILLLRGYEAVCGAALLILCSWLWVPVSTASSPAMFTLAQHAIHLCSSCQDFNQKVTI